jgi:hypothetical protein
MVRKSFLCLCLVLLALGTATAADRGDEPKELSGMSIVGNDEAPKSLYIVPWKSSEIGVETSLGMMLDERAVPVDREVFMRQLAYYETAMEDSGNRKAASGTDLSDTLAGSGF